MKRKLLLSGLVMAGGLLAAEAAFAVNVLDNAWYAVRVNGDLAAGTGIDQSTDPYTASASQIKMDSLASSAKAGKAPKGCYLNTRVRQDNRLSLATYCAADHGDDGIGWELVAYTDLDSLGLADDYSSFGDDWASLYFTNQGKPTWTDADSQNLDGAEFLELDASLVFAPKAGASDGKGSKINGGKGLLFFAGNETSVYGTTTGTLTSKWVDIKTLDPALTSCADDWWEGNLHPYCVD